MGKDGFHWFVGVVESRNDPSQINRVQVRVLGHHTDNKKFNTNRGSTFNNSYDANDKFSNFLNIGTSQVLL